MHFFPGIEYVPRPFTVIDGRGREKTYKKPFECYLDPFTGKIKELYVQGPDSICRLSTACPNATWKRTPIRKAAPTAVRIANLPFYFIPPERRGDTRLFTTEDWLSIILMWIPTVVLFFFVSCPP